MSCCEIFNRKAERFEDGDFVGCAATGLCAVQNFADLGVDAARGDDVARFFARRVRGVHEDGRSLERIVIEFAPICSACPPRNRLACRLRSCGRCFGGEMPVKRRTAAPEVPRNLNSGRSGVEQRAR